MFDDFLRPWNEWIDKSSLFEKMMTVPAVNIRDNTDHYLVSLAAPGLKKEDFDIDVNGNMITISSKKEEKSEEKEENFTRKEYSYTSFTRSFSIPDDVKQDSVDANYENGVLNIRLPRKEEFKNVATSKRIAVK